MALLASLCSNDSVEQMDAILFEIPPLHRFWEPTFTIDWDCANSGFNLNRNDDKVNLQDTHSPLPDRYDARNDIGVSGYFFSGGSHWKSSFYDDTSILANSNSDDIKEFLKEKSILQSDFYLFKNVSMLSTLEIYEDILGVPIYTFSFENIKQIFDQKQKNSWKYIENKQVKKCLKEKLSSGRWPSNIGIPSILYEYRLKFQDNTNLEYWCDVSHPSGKGNKWIVDNIFMKNEVIRKLILE